MNPNYAKTHEIKLPFLRNVSTYKLLVNIYVRFKFSLRSIIAILSLYKNEVFNEEFLSKCDQIHRKLRIWSYLLKKSFMENVIFLFKVKDR